MSSPPEALHICKILWETAGGRFYYPRVTIINSIRSNRIYPPDSEIVAFFVPLNVPLNVGADCFSVLVFFQTEVPHNLKILWLIQESWTLSDCGRHETCISAITSDGCLSESLSDEECSSYIAAIFLAMRVSLLFNCNMRLALPSYD